MKRASCGSTMLVNVMGFSLLACFFAHAGYAAEGGAADEPVAGVRIMSEDFENSSLAGWELGPKDAAGSVSIAVDDSEPYAGAAALKIKTLKAASGKASEFRNYFFPIVLPKAGEYGELRFVVRAKASGCAQGDVVLSVLEGNPKPNWLDKEVQSVVPVSKDWRLLTFSGVPKSETKKVVLFVRIKNTAPVGTTVMLDDLTVEGMPANAGMLVWHSGFEDERVSAWNTAPKGASNTVAITLDPSAPYAGVSSLKFKKMEAASQSNGTRRIFRDIPLPKAGACSEIRFSVRAHAQGCAPGDIFISVLEAGTPPRWMRPEELAAIPVSPDWEPLAFTGEIKAETARIALFIQIKNSAPAGATAWLDDFRIEGIR